MKPKATERDRRPWTAAAFVLHAALLLLLLLLLPLTFAQSASAGVCPNEVIREAQRSTFLPDCRAYEMVSPADKNGGGVGIDSARTHAAADGSAVGFISLTPFTGATASALTSEYMAERSTLGPGPTGTGWAVHNISPPQEPLSFGQLAEGPRASFLGEFDASFELGVFLATSPLTDDPDVAAVPDLYLVSGLHSSGSDAYELVTACPSCRARDETEGPGKGALRSPERQLELAAVVPTLAAANLAERRVLFDSAQPLTAGTVQGSDHLFQSYAGIVTLVGRIPSGNATECDDLTGVACKPAAFSLAGNIEPVAIGHPPVEHNSFEMPNVLSDGSDGHSRAFFTDSKSRLYVREDGHYTAELNASERHVPDETKPAEFWDASSNGERAFFTTEQALTDTAPVNSSNKVYEYDASKPGSDPHNLTYITESDAIDGMSADGNYVYVRGKFGKIVLWHDHTLSLVLAGGANLNDNVTGSASTLAPEKYASRVTPDGTRFLFETGEGNRDKPGQLWLYDAISSTPTVPDLTCVSCLAGGEAGASHAFVNAEVEVGVAASNQHLSGALSADGRYVFFTTADPLVAGDHNDTMDVYEYDASTGIVSLLSSGTANEGPSWFLDASENGRDVFIVTEQRLLGWDSDSANDLYDVRVDGGFPEPAPVMRCGSADSCFGTPVPLPRTDAVDSTAVLSGNPPSPPPSPPPRPQCPSGQRLSRVKGQLRCVRPPCPRGRMLKRIKHRKRCVSVTRGSRKPGGAR
jgi:hypothetical protein